MKNDLQFLQKRTRLRKDFTYTQFKKYVRRIGKVLHIRIVWQTDDSRPFIAANAKDVGYSNSSSLTATPKHSFLFAVRVV